MRFHSHLNSAVAILQLYKGEIPFHLFLKKYFSANKKYGSQDRKQIASLCYNYFRLGQAVTDISIEDKIIMGTFLCDNKHSQFLKAVKPEWIELVEKSLQEKLAICNKPTRMIQSDGQLAIDETFPFADELSGGIDANKFNLSFLIQPDLFLRIRPGNHKKVAGKLSGAGISYKSISENCIALPNASKVDAVIKLDKEAVVQDYNSQRTGDFIKPSTTNHQLSTVWDCCAASGGKSIMAYDINPNIELTVSDKRESILENLHKRFAGAGIKRYNSFIADLATDNWQPTTQKFDLIICDAPCTGSGTWARTPEQLYFFKKDSIEKYATLQKQIIKNVIPYLKKGGHLLYITCSVFKKENEEMIVYMQQKHNLQLIKKEIFKGYEMKADTMFAALFTA